MGIGLDIKFIDFLHKYATGKTNEMPLYQGNDVPYFMVADEQKNLKRINPCKKGVSYKKVKELFDTMSRDDSINLAGLGIMCDGEIIAELYKKPYESSYRHVSFSMCKSVVSMAVGIAEHEGLLTLDEKIADIFTVSNNVFLKKDMKSITIENLLTMTTGVCFDEVASAFAFDWCKEYMSSETIFSSGDGFSYNSLNTYMLGAIIVKRSGRSLMDYLQEKLFDYLDIHDITWDKCPMGIEKGGFGMKLSLIDMLKLGQLYMNKGKWIVDGKERQIIPGDWIDRSTKIHVRLNRNVIEGYGYQVWLLTDGAILFNGVFGQNVYINRDRRLVIAVTASAYDIFPDGRVVKNLMDFAGNDSNFINKTEYPFDIMSGGFDCIKQKADFTLKRLGSQTEKNKQKNRYRQFFSDCLGTEYKFDGYAGSIIPIMIQGVYSLYSSGIKSVSLGFSGDDLIFKVLEENKSFSIKLGYSRDEQFAYQIIEIKGKEFPVAAAAQLLFDEDKRPLIKVMIYYLEEVGIMSFKLMFKKGKLRFKALELPRFKYVAEKLSKEEYIKKKDYKLPHKKIPDAPDYMKYKVERVLTPVAIGKADL